MAKIRVYTHDAIMTIRERLMEDPLLLAKMNKSYLDGIGWDLGLTLSDYDFCEPEGDLIASPRTPDSDDISNCKLIFKMLPGLSPAQASDVRLWATLGLRDFSGYSKKRWPIPLKSSLKSQRNHILNHWFAVDSRYAVRSQAISRLWWIAYFASGVPGMSMDEALEVLFSNSDLRQSLLERTTSANSKEVMGAILNVMLASGLRPFNRSHFRLFMQRVNLIGGRTVLTTLDVDKLIEIFTVIFEETRPSTK